MILNPTTSHSFRCSPPVQEPLISCLGLGRRLLTPQPILHPVVRGTISKYKPDPATAPPQTLRWPHRIRGPEPLLRCQHSLPSCPPLSFPLFFLATVCDVLPFPKLSKHGLVFGCLHCRTLCWNALPTDAPHPLTHVLISCLCPNGPCTESLPQPPCINTPFLSSSSSRSVFLHSTYHFLMLLTVIYLYIDCFSSYNRSSRKPMRADLFVALLLLLF